MIQRTFTYSNMKKEKWYWRWNKYTEHYNETASVNFPLMFHIGIHAFSSLSPSFSLYHHLSVYLYLLFLLVQNRISEKFTWRQKDPNMNVTYAFEGFEPPVKVVGDSHTWVIFCLRTLKTFKVRRAKTPIFSFFEISLHFWHWVCSILSLNMKLSQFVIKRR